MADELRIADITGLTYTCEVREADGTLLSTESLTESGSTGRYYGDFPSGTATTDTTYDLIYVEDSTARQAVTVHWNGSKLLGVEDAITATGFSTHNAAAVRTEMDSNSTQLAAILSDIGNLNDLDTTDIDARLNAYDAPTNSEMVAAFTEIKGAGWNSGTDTLEEIRDNVGGGGSGGATASEIADAVWDEAKADHNTSGTFGESLNNAGSGSSASDIADAIIAQTSTIAITSPFNPVTNSLDIIIGQTLDFTITRAFSASWSHIEFVIKDRIDSAVGDDDAILKGIVYADATPGGLIVLNKQAVVGGTSSVVITADQPNNTTRIKVLDGITYQLTKAAKLYFTVRWVDSSSDSQSVSGQAQAGYVAAEGGDA